MGSEVPVRIFWEGKLNLHNIEIEIEHSEYTLPDILVDEKEGIWLDLKRRDPDAYDGTIYVVMFQSRSSLKLQLRSMKYSDYKTLQFTSKTEISKRFFMRYGAFSVAYLIFNSTGEYVLIGKRRSIGAWGDGFWACPGGLIEFDPSHLHTPIDVQKLLTNELEEEVLDPLSYSEFMLIGILASAKSKFSNMVLSTHASSDIDLEQSVRCNREFVGHLLQWKSVEEIRSMKDDKLFGGLRFLKYSKYQL